MVELEALPFKERSAPDVFTQFRKAIEQHARCVGSQRVFPAPLPRPSPRVSFHAKSFLQEKGLDAGELPSLEALLGQDYSHGATTTTTAESSPRPVLPFKGGEQEALDRVQSYIWDKDCLRTYKETRNGLLGADYSSKFSPWLAHGCLSPRYVYQQVKRYEEERVKNDSTYWLLFELLWRDFFVCFALKHGNTLFHKYGPQGQSPQHPNWSQDRELFNRWAEGRTGIPFIDANMRELNVSGFMSNRGRQNVASFLAKDLNIDWRMGAEYFESLLLDYDPASNYGNWLYAAGIIDPRQDRYFNILKQQTVYDKDGDYVKHWCPELAELPLRLVRQPSTITANESQRLNFYLGKDWPVPIVKLEWHGALPEREEDGTAEAKRRQRTEPKQLTIEESRGWTKEEGMKKSGSSRGRNQRVGRNYGRKVAGHWELDKGEL
ncbi:Cryptochrome DASH [Balamuthia mandrillaris]